MKAMILAAGLGTRLRPYTDYLAKPALPFLNIPMLYYSFELLSLMGASRFVVNTHHKPEQIEKLARSAPGFLNAIEISPELEAPLGSGGGISKARTFFRDEETFLVANGDEVLFPNHLERLKEITAEHRRSKRLATIVVTENSEVGTKFGGVWADKSGKVQAFGKTPQVGLKGWHYIGLLVLDKKIFDYLPQGESNIFYDVIVKAIQNGEAVSVAPIECTWFETGNPTDYLNAHQECLKQYVGHEPHLFLNLCFKRFWSGQRTLWNEGTAVTAEQRGSARLLIGRDCEIHSSVRLKGFVVLGDGVKVEAGAVLENIVAVPGAKITGAARKNEIVIV